MDIDTLSIIMSSAIIATLTAWRHFSSKKKEILDPVAKDTEISKKISDECVSLRSALNVARVHYFNFHNGGHYKNGSPIIKFTCVAESVGRGISSTSEQMRDCLCSLYITGIEKIVQCNPGEVATIIREELPNSLYKAYMLRHNSEVHLAVPVSDVKDRITGFILVSKTENKLEQSPEQETKIIETASVISYLLHGGTQRLKNTDLTLRTTEI